MDRKTAIPHVAYVNAGPTSLPGTQGDADISNFNFRYMSLSTELLYASHAALSELTGLRLLEEFDVASACTASALLVLVRSPARIFRKTSLNSNQHRNCT